MDLSIGRKKKAPSPPKQTRGFPTVMVCCYTKCSKGLGMRSTYRVPQLSAVESRLRPSTIHTKLYLSFPSCSTPIRKAHAMGPVPRRNSLKDDVLSQPPITVQEQYYPNFFCKSSRMPLGLMA